MNRFITLLIAVVVTPITSIAVQAAACPTDYQKITGKLDAGVYLTLLIWCLAWGVVMSRQYRFRYQ